MKKFLYPALLLLISSLFVVVFTKAYHKNFISVKTKSGNLGRLISSPIDAKGFVNEKYAVPSFNGESRKINGNEAIIWERKVKNGEIVNASYFSGQNQLDQYFYPNGMIKETGYVKEDVNGGFRDGEWREFDSLGRLLCKTIYDYPDSLIKETHYSEDQIDSVCQFKTNCVECDWIPNGVWEYGPNGSRPRKVVYIMGKIISGHK